MEKKMTRIMAWISIASVIAGCASGVPKAPEYVPVMLGDLQDPLVQARNFTPWRPPRQMAAFIHPHEDREQGVMIAGHWIMVLLGEGSWYFQEEIDRDPIPDTEATPEEIRAALGSVSVPRDAVIPYRAKDPVKP